MAGKKAGRQLKVQSEGQDKQNIKELELEARVKSLENELEKKDGAHKEELRAANAIDPSHYFELLDEVEKLREKNKIPGQGQLSNTEEDSDEEVQTQPTAASPTAPSSTINETVTVVPLQLMPPKVDRRLQLIDHYRRKKEELARLTDEKLRAQYVKRLDIRTTKKQIQEVETQARSTQTSLQSPEPSPDAPATLPAEETFPMLPIAEQSADQSSQNKRGSQNVASWPRLSHHPSPSFSAAARSGNGAPVLKFVGYHLSSNDNTKEDQRLADNADTRMGRSRTTTMRSKGKR